MCVSRNETLVSKSGQPNRIGDELYPALICLIYECAQHRRRQAATTGNGLPNWVSQEELVLVKQKKEKKRKKNPAMWLETMQRGSFGGFRPGARAGAAPVWRG